MQPPDDPRDARDLRDVRDERGRNDVVDLTMLEAPEADVVEVFDHEADNVFDGEADNVFDGEADDVFDGEADDVFDGEADNVFDGEADNVFDGEADNVFDGEAEPDNRLDGDDIEIVHSDEIEELEADEVAVSPLAAGRRPPVDPRIRARRIAVAREQGRRRLRVVLVLLSVIVVGGSGFLLVHSPFFDVDHIVVTGVPEASVAAIVTASGVHRHDPLLLLSAGKVERRVERVPGIGSVHVSRDFPGTVHIAVRELGVALWARVPAGGVALVGHDGRVTRYAPAPPPGVAELRGVTRVPGPGGLLMRADIVDVLDQLPVTLLACVGAMSAATPDDIRLYLKVGGEVRLGDLSTLHDKAVVAEAVIVRMACALVYVDVRSLSNPVALPAPGATCNP